MNFDRIITSVPINRTASVVAKGSYVDDPLTPNERRQNLVKLARQIERAIQASGDPQRKKHLGQRKLEVQQALSEIRSLTDRGRKRDLGHWIIAVVKERMTKAQFMSVVEEARRRQDDEEKQIAAAGIDETT